MDRVADKQASRPFDENNERASHNPPHPEDLSQSMVYQAEKRSDRGQRR